MPAITSKMRILLLVFAVVALVGPNGLFLYYYYSDPGLLSEAQSNPIALAFMIEAMFLLVLFLVMVWQKTRSAGQVIIYLGLSLIGSLAFSAPLFLYMQSKPAA